MSTKPTYDLDGRRDTGSGEAKAAGRRRPAVADGRELYHVVHPRDTIADLWTADYLLALHLYEQFVRRYGAAHLHGETLQPGQYDAECLLRTGVEEAV